MITSKVQKKTEDKNINPLTNVFKNDEKCYYVMPTRVEVETVVKMFWKTKKLISGNRMTGNIVYVCFDETEASCSSCGALGNIPTKGWGELSCDVRGSFIKIVAPSSYLQLAQVDPIGTGEPDIYVEKVLFNEKLFQWKLFVIGKDFSLIMPS